MTTTHSASGWSRRDRVIAYTFVAGQVVLLAAVFAPARRRHGDRRAPGRATAALTVAPGAVLAAAGMAGLGRHLTALPLPTDDAVLRTTGIYAKVRHPIYTGVMLASLARAAVAASPARLAAAGLLLALLDAKASWEEKQLAARFPAYAAYARRTPKFLPDLRRRTASVADPAGGVTARTAGAEVGPVGDALTLAGLPDRHHDGA